MTPGPLYRFGNTKPEREIQMKCDWFCLSSQSKAYKAELWTFSIDGSVYAQPNVNCEAKITYLQPYNSRFSESKKCTKWEYEVTDTVT